MDSFYHFNFTTKAMLLRGPYEALQGPTISETYSLKGVNTDDFVEYAGTAKYDTYRKDQTLFLDEVLASAKNEFLAEGVDYRIGICHIPVTFSEIDNPLISYKNEWITRLNQMQLSVMYSGHLHDLMFVDSSLGLNTTLTLLPEFSGKT